MTNKVERLIHQQCIVEHLSLYAADCSR